MSPAAPPDLTDAEVASICAGLKQNAARVRFLKRLGVNVERRPGGSPLVSRQHYESVRRGQVVDLVAITPRMAALLASVRALNREGLYLFPTDEGNQYTDRGFKTLWQRSVSAALAEKIIRPDQRFNFHALRRYYNTMHKAQFGVNANLHANPAVTARVYDATKEERRSAL